MTEQTRILLFTGDGKGKTTAALGTALRAAGHEKRVCILQFIKSDTGTGEIAAIDQLPQVEIDPLGLGFLPPADHPLFAEHKEAAQHALIRACEIIEENQADVIVLDEICLAVARGLINEEHVIQVVSKARPDHVLILTGRNAPNGLIALADTVTEMRCLKHAMDTGTPAQMGVER